MQQLLLRSDCDVHSEIFCSLVSISSFLILLFVIWSFDSEAVPKKILELMNVPGLTRENVASHLQVLLIT